MLRNALILLAAVGIVLPLMAAAHDTSAEKAFVLATIVNPLGQPIADAEVVVLKWTGRWESIEAKGKTDADGHVEIDNLPTDVYLSLVVHAKGYASTMQDFEFSNPERRTVSIKLNAPARGWLNVAAPDGQPVEGAEIQRLDFTDANGSKVVITGDTIEALRGKLSASAADGRLDLPEVPADAMLTIWVLHPKWKLGKLPELRASSSQLATATLQPGVPVRIELRSDEISKDRLEGLVADVLFFPITGDSSHPETIKHKFPIKNGAVEFTAYATNYAELRFTLKDYFLTPRHQNRSTSPNPLLDLRDGEATVIPLTVRPKVKASGRVVDAAGRPMPDVWVSGLIENLLVDWRATGRRSPENQQWGSAGDATSDQNGEYEIELATGKAAIDIIHEGYFADPSFVVLDVAADGSTKIPTITMRPVPILKGKILSPEGRPIAGAIARMRSTGYGDADPVGLTDADGNFELHMSRIPYRRGADGLETNVFVIGIDPKRKISGRAAVDLTDADATAKIVVPLGPQDVDWILDPLADQRNPAKAAEASLPAESIEDLAVRFAAGMPGRAVPNLAEGTWLNSDAKSLEDFRGKYVLLDFWFVGCGPCHRDMPSVKLTHAAFKEMGFSVVSIHINTQTPDNVRQFANSNGMTYPIVVDDANGTITKQFNALGVSGYPSYILVDPEGKVLINDCVHLPKASSLRLYKTEAVYHALISRN